MWVPETGAFVTNSDAKLPGVITDSTEPKPTTDFTAVASRRF